MLQSFTRNVLKQHGSQTIRFFSANTCICENLRGHLLCIPRPRVSNTNHVMMKSSFVIAPRTKFIGWGIAGTAILASTIFIDKSCILLTVIPLMVFNYRDMYIILRTFPRDIRLLKRYGHAMYMMKQITANNWTLFKLFKKTVKANSNAVMMSMDEVDWKYKEVNSYANRVSRLFQKHKLSKGDVVCIMLTNCPEMICIILGLSQIGVIAALINHNLMSVGLKHSIDISEGSFLITDSGHIPALEEIRSAFAKNVTIYQLKDEPKADNYLKFEEELYKESDEAPEVIVPPSHDDTLCYIYTSGTSGLPKAAILPHSKFLVTNLGSSILIGITKKNKLYNPLPLYHTTGLIVGAGASITRGVPMVTRSKFSSYTYFTDCIKHKCTMGTYIGEICRYIYMVPPASTDKAHNMVIMLGNGLNYQLWPKFHERFNVNMVELYGSTEGNCNMINIDGRIGAVGFLPTFAPFFFYPYFPIKIDEETQKPKRGADGLCIKCNYGERGMLVGRIKETPESKFYGYISKDKEVGSNIIKNVFKQGDRVFLTGDVFIVDEFLYFYFKDRTSDGFRWKGENVSTFDVESVVALLIEKTCACYGTKLKGHDGYAGMLCIEDPEGTIDLYKLLHGFIHHLPRYSIPRFIRIVKKIEMTSTHKIVKRHFVKEGINLDVIKDKVYYLDNDTVSYLPLTKEIIKDIEEYKIPM